VNTQRAWRGSSGLRCSSEPPTLPAPRVSACRCRRCPTSTTSSSQCLAWPARLTQPRTCTCSYTSKVWPAHKKLAGASSARWRSATTPTAGARCARCQTCLRSTASSATSYSGAWPWSRAWAWAWAYACVGLARCHPSSGRAPSRPTTTAAHCVGEGTRTMPCPRKSCQSPSFHNHGGAAMHGTRAGMTSTSRPPRPRPSSACWWSCARSSGAEALQPCYTMRDCCT